MSVTVRDYPGGKHEVDIRFKLPNGDTVRKKIVLDMGRNAAKKWGEAKARDLYDKAMRSGGAPEPTSIPTLQAFSTRFIEEYAKANQHKPSGVESKESILRLYLLPKFGSKRLDEISDSDIARLKADLVKKRPKTVNNILSVLSKLLKTAVHWRVILEMPARIDLLKSQDKEMKFHEPQVYERLVTAAHGIGPNAELLVRLGGDAGLRRGELLGLRGDHVDTSRKLVVVQSNMVRGTQVDTKGLTSRRVPLMADLARLIDDYFQGTKGHLLHQPDGSPMTAKMLRGLMAQVEKAAGLDGLGQLHILRHTYCSHLAMAGVPVMKIQRYAGHANLMTTLKYMHLAPTEDHERDMELLEQLRIRARSSANPDPERGGMGEAPGI